MGEDKGVVKKIRGKSEEGKKEYQPQEAFTFLSRWEKEHEKFFREYRDTFTEMYSKIPWGG
jgi:hypothetical protein